MCGRGLTTSVVESARRYRLHCKTTNIAPDIALGLLRTDSLWTRYRGHHNPQGLKLGRNFLSANRVASIRAITCDLLDKRPSAARVPRRMSPRNIASEQVILNRIMSKPGFGLASLSDESLWVPFE